ncbi:Fis family transcriptional regulator [Opitutaceae bacterium TAV5]|nr:Fis family transcriptional regulator [Opitutaceae bacterium TAV5]
MALDRILILDDEPLIRSHLETLFLHRKLAVVTAGTIAQAADLVARESFDLALFDVCLPDGNGQQLLEHINMLPDRPLVVMMTGHGTIENAVACMKAGAFDYLIKPFTIDQLDILLRKAESYHQLINVNRHLNDQPDDTSDLLGNSPAMLRLRQLARRVAPTDTSVLITGENGTGKEMISREIYRHSSRRTGPYIKVNCAALSETLIESELFGHEKGAFTGATNRREGRFELANRGTLLLDEVSEISPNLQAKLLRVLQEREFERVGGTRTIKVNVRILATSNRDLARSVERGDFRSDLYYRLNVFPLHIPPLRERVDDIPLLAEDFLRRFARKYSLRIPGFSDQALAALAAYPWPGNVRELQNTIERAVILSENGRPVSTAALSLPSLVRKPFGELFPPGSSGPPFMPAAGPPALPPPPPEPIPVPPAEEWLPPPASENEPAPAGEPLSGSPDIIPLDELERQAILNALRTTGGNRTKTAELLNISIRTLRNKLHEYREQGIDLP